MQQINEICTKSYFTLAELSYGLLKLSCQINDVYCLTIGCRVDRVDPLVYDSNLVIYTENPSFIYSQKFTCSAVRDKPDVQVTEFDVLCDTTCQTYGNTDCVIARMNRRDDCGRNYHCVVVVGLLEIK